MKSCKNNHVLENIEGKVIILGRCVIHCHKCGYTTTAEEATVLYVGDKYTTNNELYHVYYFTPNLVCKCCKNVQTTYAVYCYTYEESLENYESYKTASNLIRGAIQ